MTHLAQLPDGSWTWTADGRWLLVSPGTFVALLAAACLFGYCWGLLAAGTRRRRPAPQPKRRDRRGRWS